MYKRKGKSRITVPPTVWAAIPLLETSRRVNQRCFERLAMTALRLGDSDIPAFASEDRWARVDERSVERAGRCPVMLLSLQFHNLEWWERIFAGDQGLLILNAPPPVFTEAEIGPLLRVILTEAWSAAKDNIFAASLLFGMTPPIARIMAKLNPNAIDQIVRRHATSVRPRWEENRTFWKGVLDAAFAEDSESLTRVHLHALQLLGSEASIRHA